MRGNVQARPLRLVTSPARGRERTPGRSRRASKRDEQAVVMAAAAAQRREALRSGTGRPDVALRRLPY